MSTTYIDSLSPKHLWGLLHFAGMTFSSEIGTLPFRLHLPAVIQPGKRYPLVVTMHGAGGMGSDGVSHLNTPVMYASAPTTRLDDLFILAPQCPPECHWINHGDSWSGNGYAFSPEPTKSMALALQIIDYVIATFPIDTDRMAVGGGSMGGYATYDILSRRPGMFRAAFVFCGCGDTAKVREIAKSDLRIYHGDADTCVLPDCSRRMVAALKAIGATYHYTEFPNCPHNSWDPAIADVELHHWLNRHLFE